MASAVVVELGAQIFVVGPPPSRPVAYSLGAERSPAAGYNPPSDRLPGRLLEALRVLPRDGPFRRHRGARLRGGLETRAGRYGCDHPRPWYVRGRIATPGPGGQSDGSFWGSPGTPSNRPSALRRGPHHTDPGGRAGRAGGRAGSSRGGVLSRIPRWSLAGTSGSGLACGHRWRSVARCSQTWSVSTREPSCEPLRVVGERAAALLVSKPGESRRSPACVSGRNPAPRRPRPRPLSRARTALRDPLTGRGDGETSQRPSRSLRAKPRRHRRHRRPRGRTTTHAQISPALVARRDRRIAQLRARPG